jgi:CRISPR-associated protein Cmr6
MSHWNNYQAPNIGLLFYKHIYNEKAIRKLVKTENETLILNINEKDPELITWYRQMHEQVISGYEVLSPVIHAGNGFSLYTNYPGLLCGSGYIHETKSFGDYKMGFFFDHTTGLPVIPGSTVKGVLRSFFELDTDADGKDFTGEKSVRAIKYIITTIQRNEKNIPENISSRLQQLSIELTVDLLNNIKKTVFGDQQKMGTDIFFDAVIDIQLTPPGKFTGQDFITPHHHNLLQNPTPLQFFKVLPNVAFKFLFKLGIGGLDKEIKELLFKHILLTRGAGAKTNLGYGQFNTALKKTRQPEKQANTQNREDKRTGIKQREEKPVANAGKEQVKRIAEQDEWVNLNSLERGAIITASIIKYEGGTATLQLHIKSYTELHKLQGRFEGIKEIQVIVKETGGKKEKDNFTITKLELKK